MLAEQTRRLGELTPDLPVLRDEGLLVADGLYPTDGGYRNWFALDARHPGEQFGSRVRGAGVGQSDGEIPFTVAGTQSNLYYEASAGFVDKSRAAGYALDVTSRWSVIQFRNFAYAVTVAAGQIPIQFLSLALAGSNDFADHPDSNAPIGRYFGQSKDFLFLGNLQKKGVVDGSDPSSPDPHIIYWFPIANPLQNPLPEPGTDAAFAVQSDFRHLGVDGGSITGVVGAGELIYAFQQKRVQRGDYVGGDVVWRFDPIDRDRGAPVPGLITQRGSRVYFWSGDGFRVTDGGASAPIGYGKLDREVRRELDYDRGYLASAIADPQRPLILFAYSTVDNPGEWANRLLIYNEIEQRWTRTRLDDPDEGIDLLTVTFSAGGGGSPDDVDPGLGYSPDNELPDGTNGTAVTTESPDALVSGQPCPQVVGAYRKEPSHQRSSYSGGALMGEIETCDYALSGTQVQTYLRTVRTLGDMQNVTLEVGEKQTQYQQNPDWSMAIPTSKDGRFYLRSVALSHRLRLKFSSAEDEIYGVQLELRPARRRF